MLCIGMETHAGSGLLTQTIEKGSRRAPGLSLPTGARLLSGLWPWSQEPFFAALHLAVMHGRLSTIRALLTECSVDAEAFNLR